MSGSDKVFLSGVLIVLTAGGLTITAIVNDARDKNEELKRNFPVIETPLPATPTRRTSFAEGNADVYTVQHEGHEYVIARSYHGLSIIHAPTCSCAKKGGTQPSVEQ